MSVLSGLNKADIKMGSDGLLELPEERLRSIMRSEPIASVYHVEQTPFARSVPSHVNCQKSIDPDKVCQELLDPVIFLISSINVGKGKFQDSQGSFKNFNVS